VLVNNGTEGAVLNNTANISYQNTTGSLLFFNVTANTTVSAAAPAGALTNFSNITITKFDTPDPVENGTRLNYTIIVRSTGNGTAYNVTVIETYPAESIFNSAEPAPLTGTNNTFVLGNLTPGTNVTLNISVNVTQVANQTVLNNTANASFQNETSQVFLNRSASTATTTTNFSGIVDTPTPPPPASSGGGGGSGGRGFGPSPVVAPVTAPDQQVAPEVQQPLACAEDWECQDWSACVGGTQSRVCADHSACGSVEMRPLLGKTCVAESAAPTPEAAKPAPQRKAAAPQVLPCMALALGIDAVLIVLAVVLLLIIARMSRGNGSRSLMIALDTLLAIVLALVLAQRSSCKELLPLQYIAFFVIALAAVFAHLFRQLGRKNGRITSAPRAPKLTKPAKIRPLPAPKKLPQPDLKVIARLRKNPQGPSVWQRLAEIISGMLAPRTKVKNQVPHIKPLPASKLPMPKKLTGAVPAPPAPPKKQVIVLERSEPAAIAKLRQGPSVWQRLADVTRNALAPKPRLPQVPTVKPVKGLGSGTAQLPKNLRRTLDTTFRKAKITDIPDLRSEFGTIASSEDLLREFNKSVRKMKKK
jgi:hypothetical protein